MNVTADTLEKAIGFAIRAHNGQRRKGDKRPYIMHPFSVMNKIYRHKKSSNMFLLAAAAVLHDTVEDCPMVSAQMIIDEFGVQVAALVQELTLDKKQYDVTGKDVYLTKRMNEMSRYALAIKLCDRLDNVEDMHSSTKEFITNYVMETKYILAHLNRDLTKTHKKLIKKIKKELKKWKV